MVLPLSRDLFINPAIRNLQIFQLLILKRLLFKLDLNLPDLIDIDLIMCFYLRQTLTPLKKFPEKIHCQMISFLDIVRV